MASNEARRAAVAYLRANARSKRHDDEIVFARLIAGEMDELPIIQAFAAFERLIVEQCSATTAARGAR